MAMTPVFSPELSAWGLGERRPGRQRLPVAQLLQNDLDAASQLLIVAAVFGPAVRLSRVPGRGPLGGRALLPSNEGDKLNSPEPRIPICAGGSKSEGQWRREFAAGGTVNGVRVAGTQLACQGIFVADILGTGRPALVGIGGATHDERLFRFDGKR
jgi:hypothetical protein